MHIWCVQVIDLTQDDEPGDITQEQLVNEPLRSQQLPLHGTQQQSAAAKDPIDLKDQLGVFKDLDDDDDEDWAFLQQLP